MGSTGATRAMSAGRVEANVVTTVKKTIKDIIGSSRADLISPEKFNPVLKNTEYIQPRRYFNAIQNASNENETIYELKADLSISAITASTTSTKMLLNDEWVTRADLREYMLQQYARGHLFFYKSK